MQLGDSNIHTRKTSQPHMMIVSPPSEDDNLAAANQAKDGHSEHDFRKQALSVLQDRGKSDYLETHDREIRVKHASFGGSARGDALTNSLDKSTSVYYTETVTNEEN